MSSNEIAILDKVSMGYEKKNNTNPALVNASTYIICYVATITVKIYFIRRHLDLYTTETK